MLQERAEESTEDADPSRISRKDYPWRIMPFIRVSAATAAISKTQACVYTLYTIIPKTAERRISVMGESFFHLRLKSNQINERITAIISDRISVPF